MRKKEEATKQIRIRESTYNRLTKKAGDVPLVIAASNIIDKACKKGGRNGVLNSKAK